MAVWRTSAERERYANRSDQCQPGVCVVSHQGCTQVCVCVLHTHFPSLFPGECVRVCVCIAGFL